jgi:hypothetical protein
MKILISTRLFEVALIRAVVFGVAKSDAEYALLLGCIMIEFKPYNLFRKPKGPIKF